MNIQLLHETLIGEDFLKKLKEDLTGCLELQFLIAYISGKGIESIGKHLLLDALSNPNSFGVTSLACDFNYNEIINLQNSLGKTVKLKVFINLIKKAYGEESLSLLHSKIIYIKTPGKDGSPVKEVFYLGSHNWTGRALGTANGLNAEASVRFEFNDDENIEFTDGLKNHLKMAWDLNASLPALPDNKSKFDQWYQVMCPYGSRMENGELLEPVLVLTAVGERDYFKDRSINNLISQPVYLQAFLQEDAKHIDTKDQRVFILFWKNVSDLEKNILPTILYSRVSTIIETEKGGGSNSSRDGIAGFKWMLRDRDKANYSPQSTIVNGLGICEFWTLEDLVVNTTTSLVDGALAPPGQFLLEVENIIPPEELKSMGFTDLPGLFWKEGEVGFSKKVEVPIEKPEGIETKSEELTRAIKEEYERIFGVTEALPIFTEQKKQTVGLRIVKDRVNGLVLKTSEPVKEKEPSHYDEIRKNKIRLTPNKEYFHNMHERVSGKTDVKHTIKRTEKLYFEGPNKFVERLKKWRGL